jgi:uncharacterized membrane protein AbrB (regulator of aidB expression)
MSGSLSERQLRSRLGVIICGLVLVAAIFYFLQNSGALPGGEISAIKLAWLACAILFWFLLPGLLLMDERMPRAARRVCIVLLAGMLARGVIELFMMYVTNNWQPWMGISHNILMLVLMTILLIPLLHKPGRLYVGYLAVATAMFVPESGFAWYMLTYATDPGATVYFVSGDPRHRGVMIVTAICVFALAVYLVLFSRHWLYGQSER